MEPADHHQVCEYDVFLSFRGPDTRQSFADVLCHFMENAGIRVFKDDGELAVGDRIGKILEMINSSKVCVPIFSQTFAQSKWCLLEVRRMAKLGKDVMPIFYDVTPNDVKLKTPTYEGFMMEHREKFPKKKVEKWEDALKAAAGFKGMQVGDTRYTEFCKEFVEQVLKKLGPRENFHVGNPILLEGPVKAVLSLLNTEPIDGIRYVVIYGMGGSGKTTLAKVVYKTCSAGFDCSSFIEDVREILKIKGLGHLEKELQNRLDRSSKRGHNLPLKDRFRTKKVLIVLDDVDMPEQVEKLAGSPGWFGPGSRIIVTSRNMEILTNCRTLGESFQSVDICNYQVPMLINYQALQLFSRCVFEKDYPPYDFKDLSEEAIGTCGGLPLALVVIGRFLVNKEKKVWEDVIAKLKKTLDKEVKDKLKISYDKLDTDQKQIFLDIACFRACMDKPKACYFWEACQLYPHSGLAILQAMCLIQIREDNQIWMHDQLRDLGKAIVRSESIHPRKRSRVWVRDEALEVMSGKKRKTKVQGLCLDKPSKFELTKKELTSFDNIRFLHLDEVEITGNLDISLPELRWLSLRYCSKFEVRSVTLAKLVTLDLSESSVTEDWVGWSFIQSARELRMLTLSRCLNLQRTPRFPENMILDTLILQGCSNLVTIDCSIGNLEHLMHLDLKGCKRIRRLPKEISNLVKLNTLSLSGCLMLEKLPRLSFGKLKSLVELDLSFTRCISKLPESVGELVQLKRLNLEGTEIEELPSFVCGLVKLEDLNMRGCRGLKTLPESIGNMVQLRMLNLKHSQVAEIPCSIGSLKSLEFLCLDDTKIVELPSSVGGLVKLRYLSMKDCRVLKMLPESIGELKSLFQLDLNNSGILKLPHSFGGLKSATQLNLGSTSITELPDSVGDLESVLAIYMEEVSKLPSSISLLPHLRMLILNNCLGNLRELPELPVSLTELHIDSKSQQILKVDSLANLVNLKRLRLCANVSALQSVFSRLCKLSDLLLNCRNLECLWQLPSSLNMLVLKNVNSGTNLPCMSNLKILRSLTLENWSKNVVEVELLGLKELNNLTNMQVERCSEDVVHQVCRLNNLSDELTIGECEFRIRQTLDVSALTDLHHLTLMECQGLVNIIGPAELKCLSALQVYDCNSLKGIEEKMVSSELKYFRVVDCPLLYESCNALQIFQQDLDDPNKVDFPYFFCGTWEDLETRLRPF